MNNNNICIYTKLIFYIRTVWVFLEHLFKFSTKQAKKRCATSSLLVNKVFSFLALVNKPEDSPYIYEIAEISGVRPYVWKIS